MKRGGWEAHRIRATAAVRVLQCMLCYVLCRELLFALLAVRLGPAAEEDQAREAADAEAGEDGYEGDHARSDRRAVAEIALRAHGVTLRVPIRLAVGPCSKQRL